MIPPIYQTSTYAQDAVGAPRLGYEYSRSGNPTRDALQECLAALEGGRRGLAFASGLAAEDTLLRTVCQPGDHVVIPDDAYGGTYRLFAKVAQRWGLEFTPAKVSDLGRGPGGDPARPHEDRLGGDADQPAARHRRHRRAGRAWRTTRGALLVVDNTFASPYLQQPIALGADVVVHSTTKYVGGHSDVVGGALVVADAGLGEELRYHQNAMGAINGPFDAWLTLRGIKTLGVRMDRHCDNAERIAAYLDGHAKVAQVLYPGLPAHPGHEVAAKQMRRFGGMISFRAAGGEEHAVEICNRAKLFVLAESLGGVESLIEHPGRMTHASAAGSPLEVPGDLVRLSVGIETVDDLLADLEQALG